jgi:hypothetical protein
MQAKSTEHRSGLQRARKLATEDVFRQTNERIAASAHELGLKHRVPFLCECSDTRCTRPIRLDLAVYEGIRADSAHYLAIPGHAIGEARVIEETDAVAILEK